MRKFTDIFIERPVLATVVSLTIFVLGLRSIGLLPVLQYPRTQNAVVTVTTVYVGADPALVAGFITAPLENSIAQANGIDYMSSVSRQSVSTITIALRLNYEVDKALTEINTKVNAVVNQLPPGSQQPVLTVTVGQTIAAMYIGFASDVLPPNKITDYLIRVVQPKLQAVEGVQSADILGGKLFAMRAWLDPDQLAAYNLTAADISSALAANNFLSAVGTTKGQMVQVNLTASTNLRSVEEFKNLVIKQQGGAVVRLSDVAKVTLGAEDYDSEVGFDGKKAVYIGISVAPAANLLDVIARVRNVFPGIQAQLPQGLQGEIVYDSTKFVNSAIDEVISTLAQALVIVTLVVFAFLGSVRSVVIPTVAIPLSLVGTFTLMFALGYSINLLTLLALVLAIGLVVDDAIIVVENVNRHLDEGMKPVPAAIQGARELGGPIVAMTVVLVAVYVPIGFQGGLTGALFTEFAFSLAGAVAVSGVVALTLSPMMCAVFFRSSQDTGRFVELIDRNFEWFRGRYHRALHALLDTWPVVIVMGVLLVLVLVACFKFTKSELAPEEYQGVVLAHIQGPPNATAQQMQTYADQVFQIASQEPEYNQMFQITGVPTINQGIGGVLFKPWNQRTRSAHQLQLELQPKWAQIAGAQVFGFQFPPLPGSSGYPVQFVITTTEPFQNLNDVAQAVVAKALGQHAFYFADVDLKLDKPQATLEVDRDKVAALGLSQSDVGSALGAALGGGYVNYFSIAGRSYKVIPQVQQVDRLNPEQVLDYYIRTPSGTTLPASTVAHIKYSVEPESINRFQQLNSVTIAGVSGMAQGDILKLLKDALAEVAPSGYHLAYSGQSRQFVQESGGFFVTLGFAIIIVFLALAAQFESFRDPIVILMSVPLALLGAVMFMTMGFASLNIYTQVGLVTLLGLISKHGILIVQFANQLQRAGRSKREAIEEASSVRLRPILMTTAAMVLGVVPLVIASGAGAAGRHDMGLVIFAGLSIGTLFTLFVVPGVYMLIGADHSAQTVSEIGLPQSET